MQRLRKTKKVMEWEGQIEAFESLIEKCEDLYETLSEGTMPHGNWMDEVTLNN